MPTNKYPTLAEELDRTFAEHDPIAAKDQPREYERKHLDVLQRYFAAIGFNDFSSISDFMTEDVELDIYAPAQYPYTRHAKGRENVCKVARGNYESVVDQRPTLLRQVSQGDLKDLTMEETGTFKATGSKYHCIGVMQFEFRDCRVARATIIIVDKTR